MKRKVLALGLVSVAMIAAGQPAGAARTNDSIAVTPQRAARPAGVMKVTVKGSLARTKAKVILTGVRGSALGVRRVLRVRRVATVRNLPAGRYRLIARKKTHGGRTALPNGSVRYLLLRNGKTARVAYRYATVPVSKPLTFKTLATGSGFTCGVTRADRGYCWGANWGGELGTGHTRESWRPVPVAGNHRFADISARATACGTSVTGDVLCWGTWEDMRSTVGSLVPKRLFTGGPWSGVSGTCALTRAGAAWCWGWNQRLPMPAPAVVPGGHVFTHISARDDASTCGLDEAGTAWCWGRDFAGSSWGPISVPGGMQFLDIGGSCGLDTAKAVWCWSGSQADLTPRLMPSSQPFVAVTGGPDPCALDTHHKAWCWDDRNNLFRAVPGKHRLVTLAEAVGGYWNHRCGLDRGGKAWCWGHNSDGELGNGTTKDSARPVAVLGPGR